MKQPRIRKATVRADGGTSYVDLGPGKRMWSMTLLCKNDMVRYDNLSTAITRQSCHSTMYDRRIERVGPISMRGVGYGKGLEHPISMRGVRGWMGAILSNGVILRDKSLSTAKQSHPLPDTPHSWV